MKRILWVVVFLFAGSQVATAQNFPRAVEHDDGSVTLHLPQIEQWQDYELAEGRLVVNTITLESLSQFQDWAKKRNLSFSGQQIAIQRINAFAKGKFHRYEALNPIHSLVIEK